MTAEQLTPEAAVTAEFGSQICTIYVLGIAKVKGPVTFRLDMDGGVGLEPTLICSPGPINAAPR